MISISKAEHLPSFRNRGPWELRNGLGFHFAKSKGKSPGNEVVKSFHSRQYNEVEEKQ